jgi:hypothetical protein
MCFNPENTYCLKFENPTSPDRPDTSPKHFPSISAALWRGISQWVMLIGVFSGLSFQERARHANVILLTLGPHGSNFADVVDALRAGLIPLDRGIETEINGETVRLCAFYLCRFS